MSLRSTLASGLVATLCFSAAQLAWAENTEVILGLQNQVDMEELAKSVTDPSSPRYQQFYTTEEIRQLAAPSDQDYESTLKQLQSDGIEVVSESPSHLFVTVRGDRSYFEDMDAKLSSTVQGLMSLFSKPIVTRVHGLTQGTPRRPRMKFLPMAAAAVTFSGLTPAQIQTSYGFDAIYNTGVSGKGQDIAIATYDGFLIGDVTDYYKKNGINTTRTVEQVTFNGTPKFDPMSATETQTDAEFSGMIAPGANIHIYASATNGDPGELAMFTKILDDGVSKIINYSWGSCETEVTAAHRADMDKVFARAVAQGVNITVATGDSGSDCIKSKTSADYPAVEPYIVAVGGTTLTPATAKKAGSEKAWSGSGGGVSTLYGAASFQSSLKSPYSAHRSYPDVAFNADPNSGEPTWVHLNPATNKKSATAQYVVMGGTSIAAPQWAGFLALVNEARGSKAIGFIDPILYSLAAKNQATYFNDVTSGSDGTYSAAAGWDAVTGWGSMKADRLLAELKSQ